MKRKFLWLCIGLISLCNAGYSQNLGAEQEEIRKMEMIWMTALAKKDSLVLEQSLGSDFELAKVGAEASTNIKRQQWLKNSLEMDWSNFAFTSMQIRIDSNVATVNSELSFKLKPYPFRLSSGIVDVWRKSGGTWKVDKRYLGQDNLSRWLLILTGVGIGILIPILWRWIAALFRRKPKPDK
jgi:hypothetical protein